MQKILIFILAALLTVGCTSCTDREDADTTDTANSSIDTSVDATPLKYTYTLTGTDFSMTEYDKFVILNNKSIVEMHFASSHGGADHHRHFIHDEKGEDYQITYVNDKRPYDPYYRVVLETDVGDIIVSDAKGKAVVYNKNWDKLSEIDDIYFAFTLDGGRYFAVNDTECVEIDYAIGVDGCRQEEIYALYRYTEKLTECKYSSIVECDGGYACIYTDEKGEVQSDIIPVKDKIIPGVADIVPAYNEETQKYYLSDKSGAKIIDDEFDYISNIVDNRAVVLIEDEVYILDLIVS